MLGVIGIHTGAFSLTNPLANIHLFALLEIASRFSVPIFFFVSAYGLFRQYPANEPFDQFRFLRRRFNRVIFPYVAWSLLYMAHYTWFYGDSSIWVPTLVYKFFLFGMASYQLYFLVLLIWFYLMMPLWRPLVRAASARPAIVLLVLGLIQVIFDYYSSYIWRPNFASHWLNVAFEYRMSWWVSHYILIFVLGGVFAERHKELKTFFTERRFVVTTFFFGAAAALLSYYYFLLLGRGYSLEQAVNTAHQLSPLGIIYTVAACGYLYMLFDHPLPKFTRDLLGAFGRYSYPVFLVHPFFMHYLYQAIVWGGMVMDVPVTVTFYVLTLGLSLCFGMAVERLTAMIKSGLSGQKV